MRVSRCRTSWTETPSAGARASGPSAVTSVAPRARAAATYRASYALTWPRNVHASINSTRCDTRSTGQSRRSEIASAARRSRSLPASTSRRKTASAFGVEELRRDEFRLLDHTRHPQSDGGLQQILDGCGGVDDENQSPRSRARSARTSSSVWAAGRPGSTGARLARRAANSSRSTSRVTASRTTSRTVRPRRLAYARSLR